jgi:hypothetical protein
MSLNDNLGRRIDWFGRTGTIQGVWIDPTYSVAFDDGQALTVGASKVTFIEEPAKPLAWDDANQGDVWLLTDPNGEDRPHVRSTGGWRSFGRKNHLFPSDHFRDGHVLWTVPPAKEEWEVICHTDHGLGVRLPSTVQRDLTHAKASEVAREWSEGGTHVTEVRRQTSSSTSGPADG